MRGRRLPGYGLSVPNETYEYTPTEHSSTVQAFIKQIDLQDIVTFGHDWGGPIGFHVAQALPDRIAGLIIGNTWAWSIAGTPKDERFSKIMGSAFSAFLNQNTNFFPKLVLRMGLKRTKLNETERAAHLAPFRDRAARRGPIVLAGQILAASSFFESIEANIGAIDHLPTLITWPTDDFAFSDSHRERLQSMFLNHSLVTLHGAGHCIAEDAPQELNKEIRTWLQRQR